MSAPQIQYPPTSGGGAPVGGTGTTNTIPRWTGASTLGDSLLSQGATGDTIFLGTPNSVYPLANRGAISINGTSTALVGFTIGGLGQGYLTASGSSLQLIAAAAKKIEIGAGGAVGMTFDTSNNVGIGTASPTATSTIYKANNSLGAWNAQDLSVNGLSNGDAVYQRWYATGVAGAVGRFGVTFQSSVASFVWNSLFNSGVQTAELMRLTGGGNLGIGTASPAGRLDVVGVAGLSWAIRAQVSSANTSPVLNAELGLNLKNTSATVGNYTSITNRDSSDNANTQINFINVNNSGSGAINFVTRDSVGGSGERARIDSAGNLGLGTTPNAWNSAIRAFDLRTNSLWNFNSGSDSVAYWTVNAYTNAAGNVVYKNSAAASQYTQIGGAHVWYRAASGVAGAGCSFLESARIDSTGNLLMAGNGTAANPIIANSTGVSGMYFPSAATVAIAANGAIAATFSKVAGAGVALGGTTGLVFDASGTQQGIKLRATPDSLDSQTLDCYQDGGAANSGGVTWTPTLTFDGLSTGVTYATQVGRYTRIGNMIYATAYISLTSKGTATGDARIAGLPTSSNTAGLYPAATIGTFANITTSGQLCGYMSPNTTAILLNQVSAAGAVTNMKDTNFTNTSGIAISICYPVT